MGCVLLNLLKSILILFNQTVHKNQIPENAGISNALRLNQSLFVLYLLKLVNAE